MIATTYSYSPPYIHDTNRIGHLVFVPALVLSVQADKKLYMQLALCMVTGNQ